jgi:hypothetical protein
MSFRSQRGQVNAAGQLEITGQLTITHSVRQPDTDWNDAYSGADYGQLVSRSTTGEAVFVVQRQSSAMGKGSQPAKGEMSAVATLRRQDFPGLRTALRDAVWPIVVEDEHCVMPRINGSLRDYSGARCTGTPVLVKPSASWADLAMDYARPNEAAPPPGDAATIQLHLLWELRPPKSQ